MLLPYPLELVPFEPVDGPDTQFGQINRPISKDPFIEAGLKGFAPAEPFKLPTNYLSVQPANDFYWPLVAELNEELFPFPWQPGKQERVLSLQDSLESAAVFYDRPPPAAPSLAASPTIDISSLAANIVQSNDKFFISHCLRDSSYREWRLFRVAFNSNLPSRRQVPCQVLHISSVGHSFQSHQSTLLVTLPLSY